jgi:hypothetical protein
MRGTDRLTWRASPALEFEPLQHTPDSDMDLRQGNAQWLHRRVDCYRRIKASLPDAVNIEG